MARGRRSKSKGGSRRTPHVGRGGVSQRPPATATTTTTATATAAEGPAPNEPGAPPAIEPRSLAHRVARAGLLTLALVLMAVTCRSAGGPGRIVQRVMHWRDRDTGVAQAASDDAYEPPATDAGREAHECEHDEDCRRSRHVQGRCFSRALLAQYTQAFRDCAEGRAWRDAHTLGTCVFDECDVDANGEDSCPAGQRCALLEMVPFPQRVCTPAQCPNDRACRSAAFGVCAAYLAGGRCVRGGWACSYPRDPCAPRDAVRMCPVHTGMITYCAPRDGRFICVDEPALLPQQSTIATPPDH